MTQQPPPSQAPSARYDQQHDEYETKKMTGLVRDDPWSQGAPLGAIPLQYRPPAPRSPAKTRRRKWPWSVGVLLLLFVIVGNYSRSSTSDFTPITHRVVNIQPG